jgi:hypothetical protein
MVGATPAVPPRAQTHICFWLFTFLFHSLFIFALLCSLSCFHITPIPFSDLYPFNLLFFSPYIRFTFYFYIPAGRDLPLLGGDLLALLGRSASNDGPRIFSICAALRREARCPDRTGPSPSRLFPSFPLSLFSSLSTNSTSESVSSNSMGLLLCPGSPLFPSSSDTRL